MAQASLIDLPVELVNNVTSNLDPLDLLNLRQTCQTIATKTGKAFRNRFFSTRYVMLQRQSLSNLVEISHHPVLSQAVRAVEVCVDHLVEPKDYMSREELKLRGIRDEYDAVRLRDGETVSLGDDSWEKICQGYKEAWNDQAAFFNQRLHTRCLLEALSRLKNCRRIGVDDHNRPWGAFQLGRRVGTFPNRFISHSLPHSVMHAAVLVRSLFSAVVQSRLPVEEIYFLFGNSMEGCTSLMTRMLALPNNLALAISTHLTTVTTLSLLVNPDNSDNHFDDETSQKFPATDPIRKKAHDWQSEFLGFLGLFSALSDLTLEFNYREDKQQFPELAEKLYIPGLRALCLGYLECTKDELVLLLERHKATLQTLALQNVGVNRGGANAWSSVVSTLREEFSLDVVDLRDCIVDGWEPALHRAIPGRLYAQSSQEMDLVLADLVAFEANEGRCSPTNGQ